MRREGLWPVEQRERKDAIKLEILRETTQASLGDLASGRFAVVEIHDISVFTAKVCAAAYRCRGHCSTLRVTKRVDLKHRT